MAAVWSCDPATSLDYPARYLFTFLEHHGMLGVFGSPQWRTVTGGSGTYVAAVAEHLPEIRLGTKVTSVRETADGVEVTDGNGETSSYDAVVVATHPAQALSMLEAPDRRSSARSSARCPTPPTPPCCTPTPRCCRGAAGARSSWNFQRPGRRDRRGDRDLRPHPPAAAAHRHPLPRDPRRRAPRRPGHRDRPDGVRAPALHARRRSPRRRRLPEIDTDRVAFAGAYHGWGFHEDGARSGLAAATRLGLPWVRPRAAAPVRPGPLRDDDPAHASYAVHAQLRAPLAPAGSSTSTTCPTTAGWPASRRATTSAPPTRPARQRRVVPRRQRRLARAPSRRRPDPDGRPPAVAGPLLQPDQRVLVLRRRRRPGGRRGRGAQHLRRPARLPRPPRRAGPGPHRQGDVRLARSTASTAGTTSPCRCPTDRLDIAVTLRGHDADAGHRRPSARRSPARAATSRSGAPSAPPCAAAPLIRVHGIWLWARRLPVRPRPTHHQEGVR